MTAIFIERSSSRPHTFLSALIVLISILLNCSLYKPNALNAVTVNESENENVSSSATQKDFFTKIICC
uniref:Uncharacterized protein n=1 Tax=Anguilla anguilla TaxID=7936 RepID=A0A0E9TZW3_ANGAN